MKLLGKTGLLVALLALCGPADAQVYTKFGPASGVLKGSTATYQTTAAASSDVIGLWGATPAPCTASSFLRGDGNCAVPSGTGVTSVGLTLPSWYTVTGSPVTGAGTLAVTATTGQTAKSFLATPTGSTGAVSLRTIALGDLPTINVAGGGTGVATLTSHGVLLGEGTANVSAVAAMAADTLLQGQGASADPVAVAVNNCGSATQALSYNTTTHAFGCQTITAGTGTVTSVGSGTGVTASPNPIVATGTLAVDQAFSPTWSGTQAFTGGVFGAIGTSSVSPGVAGGSAKIRFIQSAGAVGARAFEITDSGANIQINTCTDAFACTLALGINQSSGLPVSFSVAEPATFSTTLTGPTVTITAPTSGTALDVTGVSASNGIFVHAASASGSSFGMRIDGGTTSADFALLVQNQTAAAQYFRVQGDGAVKFPAISTTASAANAFLDSALGNNLLRSTSSRRYKQDIRPLSLAQASEVLKLQPITYRSKAAADDPTKLWFGLVAEDVAAVEPRLVAYDAQGRPDGVQYDRVGVLTLRLVQEQQRQIQALRIAILGLFLWCGYLTFRTRRA